MNKLRTVIIMTLAFTIASVGPAYAYIDPGSASIIVTTILGFLAAAGYTVRKYFYKLKQFFSKGKITKEKNGRET